MMFYAKENQQMAPEQYESGKEKSAGIQSLNKRLLYYAHYTHKLLVVCQMMQEAVMIVLC